MKKDIHPTFYPEAKVTCACGNTWTTGSTVQEIRTEVCSNCHPFFTGQLQRIVDIEGQVDRFYRKLQARQEHVDKENDRKAKRTSPDRPVEELKISARARDALLKAGLSDVGDILKKLAEGEQAMLDIDNFGRKSLIDLKKSLRQLGYELPEAAKEIAV
jgi:large subunit ribosomal protein L31